MNQLNSTEEFQSLHQKTYRKILQAKFRARITGIEISRHHRKDYTYDGEISMYISLSIILISDIHNVALEVGKLHTTQTSMLDIEPSFNV